MQLLNECSQFQIAIINNIIIIATSATLAIKLAIIRIRFWSFTQVVLYIMKQLGFPCFINIVPVGRGNGDALSS